MKRKRVNYLFTGIKWPWANRKYKDTVFRLLFNSDKVALLELYNALNNSHYDNPNDLIVNTLDNAIFMGMRNDLSFIIDTHLNIYEHQSTDCPNIPLRCLFYVDKLFSQIIDEDKIYGSSVIRIPEPHFVVFYNGTDPLPEKMTYRLSDMYEVCSDNPALELTVTILNINQGMNDSIMQSCKLLHEYSLYVSIVRQYAEKMPLTKAVTSAIDYCIAHDILRDFLLKERKAVAMYSLYEYNQAGHMKAVRKEGIQQGIALGEERGKNNTVALFAWLNKNNRQDDIQRAFDDPEYLDKLFDEFLKEHVGK
ncbi:MAG: hypothetical protein E7307_11715 [Butyrivibrio sp.]|nr:hypothetical protein [Butyrivibrio sp.]